MGEFGSNPIFYVSLHFFPLEGQAHKTPWPAHSRAEWIKGDRGRKLGAAASCTIPMRSEAAGPSPNGDDEEVTPFKAACVACAAAKVSRRPLGRVVTDVVVTCLRRVRWWRHWPAADARFWSKCVVRGGPSYLHLQAP